MKRLVTSIILIITLISCENDEIPEQIIRFSGTITNGDNGQPMPAVKIKLKLNGTEKASRKLITIWDSTETDNSGGYHFIKNIDRAKLYVRDYSIIPNKEYYETCQGNGSDFQPWELDRSLTKQVDTLQVNSDAKKLCRTGEIKLIFTKLEVPKRDTIFYKQTFQTNLYTVLRATQYSTLSVEEILLKYFARNVISVDFAFIIKKESGAVNNSNQSVILQTGATKELKISY